MLSYKGRCHGASEIFFKFPADLSFPKGWKIGVSMPFHPSFMFWRLPLELTFSGFCIGPAHNEKHLGLQSGTLRQKTEIRDCLRWHLSICTELPSTSVDEIRDVRKDGKGRPEHLLEFISCFGQMVSWPILHLLCHWFFQFLTSWNF